MEKTSKKIVVISILIATIITGIGVAFGYFIWESTSNTNISFTVEGVVVQLDDGTDITGANLMPVSSYLVDSDNVIKKNIKIKLKDNTTNTVTVDFKLKINSIDSGLNHSSFMYELVNASGTSVKSGNFSTLKSGDAISLLTLSTTDGSLTTSLTSYTLYIYIDGARGDNPSSMQNQSFDFSFIVEGNNSSKGNIKNGELLTTKVKNLDDETTGDSGSGVYKVTHSAIASDSSATGSEIPAVTDYRYYGANPNNYVCLDKEGQSTCPDRGLFRIIGSIYEENAKKNLIKVIKATPLTDGTTSAFSWDYKVTSGSGSYNNVWSSSTNGTSSGSTLMQLLNGIYLTRGTGSYYNNSTIATTVNFGSTGLTDVAQGFINKNSLYYLGSFWYGENEQIKASDLYLKERGNATNTGNSKYWNGIIGTIYPSDFGYSLGNKCSSEEDFLSFTLGDCLLNNWMFDVESEEVWTITSIYDNVVNPVALISKGDLSGFISNTELFVYPTFYLTPDVFISSGDGSYKLPYLLS